MVSGMLTTILLSAHVSVVKLRQIISLSADKTKKNNAQRTVNFHQPSSVRLNAAPKIGFSSGRLRSSRPPPRIAPKRQLTTVGLILRNTASLNQKESEPNTSTKKPPTSGMIGQRFSSHRYSGKATRVATTNIAAGG